MARKFSQLGKKKYSIRKYALLQLLVSIGLAIGWSPKVTGQEQGSLKYTWFDTMVGQTNSGIFKGVAYDEEFRVINDRHQFFENPEFIIGCVVLDQSYFNLQLRYDVFHDNLLVINAEVVNLQPMILEKDAIQSFQLGEHFFENIDYTLPKVDNVSGFLELLVPNDSLPLYKKHGKKLLVRTDKKTTYHEFKNVSTFFVRYLDKFYKIKKVSDLNAIFPGYRKSLKSIHNRHATLRKSSPDEYMIKGLLDFMAIKPQFNKGR